MNEQAIIDNILNADLKSLKIKDLKTVKELFEIYKAYTESPSSVLLNQFYTLYNSITFNSDRYVKLSELYNFFKQEEEQNILKVDVLCDISSTSSSKGNVLIYDQTKQENIRIISANFIGTTIDYTTQVIGKTVGWEKNLSKTYKIILSYENLQLYYQETDWFPKLVCDFATIIQEDSYTVIVTNYNKVIPIFSKIQLDSYFIDGFRSYLFADLISLRFQQFITFLTKVNKFYINEADIALLKTILLDNNYDEIFTAQNVLEPIKENEFLLEANEDDLKFWNKELVISYFPKRDISRKVDFWVLIYRIIMNIPVPIQFNEIKKRIQLLSQKGFNTRIPLPYRAFNNNPWYHIIVTSVINPILKNKVILISNYLASGEGKGIEQIQSLIDDIIISIYISFDKTTFDNQLLNLFSFLNITVESNFWNDYSITNFTPFLNNLSAQEMLKNINLPNIFAYGIYRILTQKKSIIPISCKVFSGNIYTDVEGIRIRTEIEIKGKMYVKDGLIMGWGSFGEITLPCNAILCENDSNYLRITQNNKVIIPKPELVKLYKLDIEYKNIIDLPLIDKKIITINGTPFLSNNYNYWYTLEDNLTKIKYTWWT